MQGSGLTARDIRCNKGYTQSYVSNKLMTQGALSKFENFDTDIGLATFDCLLNKIEMSYEEFKYIQNNYEYTYRQKLLNRLLSLTYNDKDKLKILLEEAKAYLKNQEDFLIEDLTKVCKALIILSETNDIEKSRIPIYEVWDRLSKRNLLYISDIYFVNAFLFFFPLDIALEIKNFLFRSIDKYKNFEKIERIKINTLINMTLLFVKNQKFEEALLENDQAIKLCKKHSDYLRLSICYIRKGYCLNKLNYFGEEWIYKGKKILSAIEEFNIIKILDDEIKRFSNSTKSIN